MDTRKVVGIFIAIIILIVAIVFGISQCNEDENELNQPPKLTHENSVEYYVTSTRVNDTLVVTTRKDIYSNFKLLSSTITKDTLPNIGTETVTEEDSTGNEVKKTVPKAYDIYFKSERK